VRFRSREDGGRLGPFRSDYRCQLNYADTEDLDELEEVRVYFVGRDKADAGEDLAAVLAFLHSERQRGRCRVGTRLELREGSIVTAAGEVHAIAVR
jgi:hypothetical protein